MNADGNNLPLEERRRLRIEKERRDSAEMREGVQRATRDTALMRKAVDEAAFVVALNTLRRAQEEGKLPPAVVSGA
ncbi:MAG: hypothetical protein FD144_2065 [Rhodospirillaceae bacterium]|nr:MAG: hypothetical protein FD144_2065 [Rhodospirillaceae bacterium]